MFLHKKKVYLFHSFHLQSQHLLTSYLGCGEHLRLVQISSREQLYAYSALYSATVSSFVEMEETTFGIFPSPMGPSHLPRF